jgi:integrase
MIATLKAIVNDAIREGLISEIPATAIGPTKGIEPRQRFLDMEEIERLLSEAAKLELCLQNMIVWALPSPMRQDQIRPLTWPDIKTVEAGHIIVFLDNTKSGTVPVSIRASIR